MGVPAGDRNREDPLCRRSVVGQVQDEGYTSTLCRCHYDGGSDTRSDELTTADAQCHQDALQTKSYSKRSPKRRSPHETNGSRIQTKRTTKGRTTTSTRGTGMLDLPPAMMNQMGMG